MLHVKNHVLDACARADIAAEFQAAVVDVLVAKSLAALERSAANNLVVAGGVGANLELRARLTHAADREGYKVFYPAPEFCTDNGAMIAFAAAMRMQLAPPPVFPATRGFSVRPRWNLDSLTPA